MDLTQAEIIQILRKRKELNQGTFGASAFNTSFESGRTKVKNIELGKQIPKHKDLVKMARVLDVPVEKLLPERKAVQENNRLPADGVYISNTVFEIIPDIEPYIDMLNKAATLDDKDLIAYLFEKLSDMFRAQAEILIKDATADKRPA
jgi:transcriptional regulator with XRE-family HTH domain